MKVAIVHHWLINWRGGEKVIEAFLELYPDADIFTHVYCEQLTEGRLKGYNIQETLIGKLPFAKKMYQKYLPLMPYALEQLDLRGYDLVISCESGPSKGVITDPDSLHVCYCNSPLRYIWDMYHDYMEGSGFLTKLLFKPVAHYLRMWDYSSAARVDLFLSNSGFIAKRVKKFYRRDSEVLYPPVDLSEFDLKAEKSDYYLVLGQLTAYKRADLAVNAFKKNKKKLVVAGAGEQYEELKELEDENIKVLGRMEWDQCKEHLANAKALIFPGVEDFGMVPVEAMACGTPVLAYGRGGALETVTDGVSGLFFEEQTEESLNECIERFEASENQFDPKEVKRLSNEFSKETFLKKMKGFVDENLQNT